MAAIVSARSKRACNSEVLLFRAVVVGVASGVGGTGSGSNSGRGGSISGVGGGRVVYSVDLVSPHVVERAIAGVDTC